MFPLFIHKNAVLMKHKFAWHKENKFLIAYTQAENFKKFPVRTKLYAYYSKFFSIKIICTLQLLA